MDFYDLVRSRPPETHYAVALDGEQLRCPVELGRNGSIARDTVLANSNDWLTYRPKLGYAQVVRSVMDGDGDISVELQA